MNDIKDRRSFLKIVVTLPIIPFLADPTDSESPKVSTGIESVGRNKTALRDYGLEPNCTFDNYVVARNNELAYNTALLFASEAPVNRDGPLYITGPVGTGTSHLLHAVGHKVKTREINTRVRVVQAYSLIDDCIASIRTGDRTKFHKAYKDDVDVLLIDNIEILSRGEAVQEEFKRILDHFRQNGKLLAVASDKWPSEIVGLDPKIVAQFEQGLIAAIKNPDQDTLLAGLKYKEGKLDIELDQETREFIIDESGCSFSRLFGILRRLIQASKLQDQRISLALAREVLRA